MTRCTRLLTFFLPALALAPLTVPAQTPLFWPDKNGPNLDGTVPAADAERIPQTWNLESGENILWRTPLEGEGHSTPVIGGDLIWFTAASPDGKKQWVYGLERETGAVRHHVLLFENAEPEPLGNPINNYAAPSCVLDETGVYAHFGTYGTAKLNPETAEVIWQRRDINVNHFRGPGSSPLLWENLIILTFDGINHQFITALSKDTGDTVWLTERSTDYGDLDKDGHPTRDGDMRKAYHTPRVFEIAGQPQLISVGSRSAFGYDPRTGRELWNLPHGGFNAAIRPLMGDGILYLNTGSERSHLLAVRVDDAMQGELTATHLLWDYDKRNASEADMILHHGRIIQITRGGIVSCLDAKTGEKIWDGRLEGQFLPSPIRAGDHLYVSNDRGQTFIIADQGDQMEILHTNTLDAPISAGPAVADGALFIRSKEAIYCLKTGAQLKR
ncbi:MAG: PQQ-binding-like beta-propeller repeat protein [Verrucomicrobiales bacterium]|nr:PQQ-binding-like beta-propeller repeat protein [Verrucomicrobiales bacterium]